MPPEQKGTVYRVKGGYGVRWREGVDVPFPEFDSFRAELRALGDSVDRIPYRTLRDERIRAVQPRNAPRVVALLKANAAQERQLGPKGTNPFCPMKV